MSEIDEETIARALCRRQIIANLRYDRPREDEAEFVQRCEDASWNDDAWLGPARDLLALVLPAIERARVEERERCAVAAVSHHPGSIIAREIAAAIRKG